MWVLRHVLSSVPLFGSSLNPKFLSVWLVSTWRTFYFSWRCCLTLHPFLHFTHGVVTHLLVLLCLHTTSYESFNHCYYSLEVQISLSLVSLLVLQTASLIDLMTEAPKKRIVTRAHKEKDREGKYPIPLTEKTNLSLQALCHCLRQLKVLIDLMVSLLHRI